MQKLALLARMAALVALGTAIAAAALADTVYTVAQKDRAFSIDAITIAAGDTIEFTNEDEFLHQIYVDSSDFAFDSDEQAPGQVIDVRFPRPGIFAVRCHIHPKMLLTVTVKRK